MMTTTQQDKPGGKPRQRSRKAEQRSRKSDQPNGPAPDRRDEDQIRPMVASSDAPEVETAAAAEVPLVGEVLPPVTTATSAAEPVPVDVISLQTIANAYADYARTSLQESRSFAEKLMGVRSFDKAIELQSEFARQAFANFVAESQKICGLYTRWARQSFRPWEVTAAKVTQAGRQSW